MRDCKVVVWLLQLLLVLLTPPAAAAAAAEVVAKPGCLDKCGNVSIYYPFGIGPKCSMEGFEVICNDTYNPPKPFLSGVQYTPNAFYMLLSDPLNSSRPHLPPLQLISISVAQGEARAYSPIFFNCSNGTKVPPVAGNNFPLIDLGKPAEQAGPAIDLHSLSNRTLPLTLSSARNKFGAIGCGTTAYLVANPYSSQALSGPAASTYGCISTCILQSDVDNGTCSGNGCCLSPIKTGIFDYQISFDSGNIFRNFSWSLSTCDYGFVVEPERFIFTWDDVVGPNFLDRNQNGLPFVIDWAVRNMSCQEAEGRPDYACASNYSACVDTAQGYICNCSRGFQGTPYLENGCTDINECEHPDIYKCYGHCRNTWGSYKCTCPGGWKGVSGGIVVLVAIGSYMLMKYQEREHIKEREEYFRQNGGLKLNEEMRARQVHTIQIFTKKELEKVTNNFSKDRVIGHGGSGEVYKGTLEDERTVAIKKSKVIDQSQKEEFVNEIIVLSQINHKNVVRLLGCCLEMEVPMLVYEFVSNGTVFHFIHENHTSRIPLEDRLRMAMESAEALAYLHSSASRSIIHGDVKSLNILLDDKCMVKVSDFGASKLVPMDESEFVKFVHGTQGYLDPECLSTRRLTEKSDVYSFGVVLLELITRKEPVYFDGPREKRNLAYTFSLTMKNHKLQDILDAQIVHGGMDLLQEVAELALWCLHGKGEDRPGMKEVAQRLQMLTSKQHQPLGQHNNLEKVEEVSQDGFSTYATSNASAYPSLDQTELHIDGGR